MSKEVQCKFNVVAEASVWNSHELKEVGCPLSAADWAHDAGRSKVCNRQKAAFMPALVQLQGHWLPSQSAP